MQPSTAQTLQIPEDATKLEIDIYNLCGEMLKRANGENIEDIATVFTAVICCLHEALVKHGYEDQDLWNHYQECFLGDEPPNAKLN